MSPRPRPRLATDPEILEATARAIGRVGPAKLTLADVAREVGLSPATLIQRFGSKRDLLLALASQGGEALAREFDEARGRHRSPLEALMDVSLDQTRHFGTPEELANHLAFLQMDLNDAAFRARAVEQAAFVRTEVERLLREAVDAGELVPCDTAGLARAIHALFNGSLVFWAMHREGTPAEWVRRDLDVLIAPYRRSDGDIGGDE